MDEWKKGDEVWELLGRARPVTVSPYFSRRVRAAIRTAPAARPGFVVFFLRWAGAGALAALVAGFFLTVQPQPAHTVTLDQEQFIEVFDSAAGMDALVAFDNFSIDTYARGL